MVERERSIVPYKANIQCRHTIEASDDCLAADTASTVNYFQLTDFLTYSLFACLLLTMIHSRWLCQRFFVNYNWLLQVLYSFWKLSQALFGFESNIITANEAWWLPTWYRGSPTYTKITNTVSTTTVFGLCTCKWGIFALVGDPLQSH